MEFSGFKEKMNIAFRVDGGPRIGLGHLMRCRTLARQMRLLGAKIFFITRGHPASLPRFFFEADDGVVLCLPQPPTNAIEYVHKSDQFWLGVDWLMDAQDTMSILMQLPKIDLLIIDHYGIGIDWQTFISPAVARICVIDDLADRPFYCHYLINPNICDDKIKKQYRLLAPVTCELLLGTEYIILRSVFNKYRALAKPRTHLKRILIMFSGVEAYNLIEITLKAIQQIPAMDMLEIEVIAGEKELSPDLIREKVSELNLTAHVYEYVNDIERLMLRADLAIGAAGSATWERCALGLPSLVVMTAENQRSIVNVLHGHQAGYCVGDLLSVSSESIKNILLLFIHNPALLRELSIQATQICDGLGTIRVAKYLIEA